MSSGDADRLEEIRELAQRIAAQSHEALGDPTIDRISAYVDEVRNHLDDRELRPAAEKLLAFWGAYAETELEEAMETGSAIADSTLERFEQAFDREVFGIDLYQALETLAIVEDQPAEETEEDRLRKWAERVHALTADFASHLEGHRD
ncbi:MAG: hypothetical protein ABEI31_10925 [Halodesulfurarchaeum sp.]